MTSISNDVATLFVNSFYQIQLHFTRLISRQAAVARMRNDCSTHAMTLTEEELVRKTSAVITVQTIHAHTHLIK